jgi:DNA-binding LytR/AlgR family response regulator
VPDDTGRITNAMDGDVFGTVVQIRDVYLNSPAVASASRRSGPLRVLVVDDQPLALDEIVYLLRGDDRIDGDIGEAPDVETAVRHVNQALRDGVPLDAVFLDIRMPGLNGLDLARLLARFAEPPMIVFVTADERHAVEAFELEAVDYLLKPIRPARMTAAIGKLVRR